ncbi:hypothetical protein HDV01_002472 [Terramyces sp. JEL0728]|nr:hypothetical protein HDV01_002429 [Terramyces sp. JEL0728]KAJ3274630.1 hypothetical protein HDV01_002472 [Terramyces sp. JEL0728]
MSNNTIGSSGGVTGTVPTIPTVCAQAALNIANKCYGSTSLPTSEIVTASNLDQLCGSDCSSAISTFKSTLGTCGTVVLDPSSSTNGTLFYSYVELINAFACVKDSGSYCYTQEMATIQSAGVQVTGPDAFTNVVTYLTSNTTLLCSTCVQKQFTAISSLNDLDASIGPSLQSAGGLLMKACGTSTKTAAPTATVTAGTKAAVSSFFAILLPFAIFAASI